MGYLLCHVLCVVVQRPYALGNVQKERVVQIPITLAILNVDHRVVFADIIDCLSNFSLKASSLRAQQGACLLHSSVDRGRRRVSSNTHTVR